MILKIDNYVITPGRFIAGTRGSYGIEKVSFELSHEWDGLAVSVCFYPAIGDPVSLLYTGEPFYIPAEVMNCSGSCKYVVSGFRDEHILISAEGIIRVLNTSDPVDNPAYTPTPGVFAQVMTELDHKADRNHNHDLLYAPVRGTCDKLTAGAARNLVTEKVGSFDGLLGEHAIADSVPDKEVYSGKVDKIEGICIHQEIENGNFLGNGGWSASKGVLNTDNNVGTFTVSAEKYNDTVIASYTLRVGETVEAPAEITSESQITTSDPDIISLTYDEDSGSWFIVGVGAGMAELAVRNYDIDDYEIYTDYRYLCRILDNDADQNKVMISHPMRTVAGHRYFVSADIETPTLTDKITLEADGAADVSFATAKKTGWQTVSGSFTATRSGAGKIKMVDGRALNVTVKSFTSPGFARGVVLTNASKLLERLGICDSEGSGEYSFTLANEECKVRKDGNFYDQVEVSDVSSFGLECQLVDGYEPDDGYNGLSVTVRIDYPFDISASASITADNGIVEDDIEIDAHRFARSLQGFCASGTHHIYMTAGGWVLNSRTVKLSDIGIYCSECEDIPVGKKITVVLNIGSEEIKVRNLQMLDLTAVGLENEDEEYIKSIISGRYHADGVTCAAVGGVVCVDEYGEELADPLHFSENYSLRRISQDVYDLLDLKNKTLTRKIGMQVVNGSAGDIIELSGAAIGTKILSNDITVGNVTGNKLVLAKNTTGATVYYELATPVVSDISEDDVFLADCRGFDKAIVFDNIDGEYFNAPLCVPIKIDYYVDSAKQMLSNTKWINALLSVLGIDPLNVTEGDVADLLAEKLSEFIAS